MSVVSNMFAALKHHGRLAVIKNHTATRATTVAVPGTPGTSNMMSQRKKTYHRHTDVRPSDRSNS